MVAQPKSTKFPLILGVVLLMAAAGMTVALLASGHEPSPFFIGSMAITVAGVVLAILARRMRKKEEGAGAADTVRARQLLAAGSRAEAIRVVKGLIPNAPEDRVREILPWLADAYRQTDDVPGLTQVQALEILYTDFFDMDRNRKRLDAKSRVLRQSLAERICAEVAELPER